MAVSTCINHPMNIPWQQYHDPVGPGGIQRCRGQVVYNRVEVATKASQCLGQTPAKDFGKLVIVIIVIRVLLVLPIVNDSS